MTGRAVNGAFPGGILATAGVEALPCRVWDLREPTLFRGLQAVDRERFARGQPHQIAPVLAAA